MTFRLSAEALDRDLILEFFWKFSVFECALKRERFLKTGKNGAAEPDWDGFGHAINGRFARVHNPDFGKCVTELNRLAPQRQIVRDGRLGWSPVLRLDDDSDETYTLRLMRTARNNLFHGGKYPDGTIAEIARSRAILQSALAILDGCYEVHAGVRHWVDVAA